MKSPFWFIDAKSILFRSCPRLLRQILLWSGSTVFTSWARANDVLVIQRSAWKSGLLEIEFLASAALKLQAGLKLGRGWWFYTQITPDAFLRTDLEVFIKTTPVLHRSWIVCGYASEFVWYDGKARCGLRLLSWVGVGCSTNAMIEISCKSGQIRAQS